MEGNPSALRVGNGVGVRAAMTEPVGQTVGRPRSHLVDIAAAMAATAIQTAIS